MSRFEPETADSINVVRRGERGAMTSQMAMARKRLKRSETAKAIRELIVAGELKARGRLPSERTLASRFGVGRSSVREGIRELVALGILGARQGSGTYVADLDTDDLFAHVDFALRLDPSSLLHLLELRRILEPAVAALAATRFSDTGIAQVHELWRAYEREARSGILDLERLVELDMRIHDAISEATGNPLIGAVLRGLRKTSLRSREITASLPDSPQEAVDELQAIVIALAKRDPLRAQAAMTRHLSRVEEIARRAVGGDAGGGDQTLSQGKAK